MPTPAATARAAALVPRVIRIRGSAWSLPATRRRAPGAAPPAANAIPEPIKRSAEISEAPAKIAPRARARVWLQMRASAARAYRLRQPVTPPRAPTVAALVRTRASRLTPIRRAEPAARNARTAPVKAKSAKPTPARSFPAQRAARPATVAALRMAPATRASFRARAVKAELRARTARRPARHATCRHAPAAAPPAPAPPPTEAAPAQ